MDKRLAKCSSVTRFFRFRPHICIEAKTCTCTTPIHIMKIKEKLKQTNKQTKYEYVHSVGHNPKYSLKIVS